MITSMAREPLSRHLGVPNDGILEDQFFKCFVRVLQYKLGYGVCKPSFFFVLQKKKKGMQIVVNIRVHKHFAPQFKFASKKYG